MIKERPSYETPDGIVFDNREEAVEHAYESSILKACHLANKINRILFDPTEDDKARDINYQKLKAFLLHEAREDLFELVDFMRCYPEGYYQPAEKETP